MHIEASKSWVTRQFKFFWMLLCGEETCKTSGFCWQLRQ